jgi:FkbM family methyltransferase
VKIKEVYKRLRAEYLGIDPLLMPLYCKYFYKTKKDSLAEQLDIRGSKKPFCFLQIGGNDGFANDPIFRFVKKYGWKGIIAEPQEEVFNTRLKKTYRFEKNVHLENKAVTAETGIKLLYKLAVSNSRWATGLATFNKEVMLDRIKNNDRIKTRALKEGAILPAKDEDYITTEEVHCVSILDLMSQHGFTHLDLLQIDTEGYDFEIIKTIDFSKVQPKMISFERHLLSAEDQDACKALLTAQGYTIQDFGGDSLATL